MVKGINIEKIALRQAQGENIGELPSYWSGNLFWMKLFGEFRQEHEENWLHRYYFINQSCFLALLMIRISMNLYSNLLFSFGITSQKPISNSFSLSSRTWRIKIFKNTPPIPCSDAGDNRSEINRECNLSSSSSFLYSAINTLNLFFFLSLSYSIFITSYLVISSSKKLKSGNQPNWKPVFFEIIFLIQCNDDPFFFFKKLHCFQ